MNQSINQSSREVSMSNSITFPNGKKYRSHDMLVQGPHSNAAEVGVANIRSVLRDLGDDVTVMTPWQAESLEEGIAPYARDAEGRLAEGDLLGSCPTTLGLLLADGSGNKQMFLRDGEHGYCWATLGVLDSYPSLDDKMLDEVRTEIEKEAWEGWLRSELLKTLDDGVLNEWMEECTEEEQWGMYLEAKEGTPNFEVTFEGLSAFVNVRTLETAFRRAVVKDFKEGGQGDEAPPGQSALDI
jgi:hypothetical protein